MFINPTSKVDTGTFKVQIPIGEAFLSTALGLKPSEKMNHEVGRPLRGYSYLDLLSVESGVIVTTSYHAQKLTRSSLGYL